MPAPPPNRLLSGLLRLAAVAVILLLLARSWSVEVVTRLVPVIGAEITALDRNLSIGALELADDVSGHVVRLRANLRWPVVVGGRTVDPLGWQPNTNGWYEVRISARGVLQSTLVYLAAVLAWPGAGWRAAWLRLGLVVPFGALMFALDTAPDLLGNFQEAVVRRVDTHATTALFVWARFLEGGGNVALALGLAMVTIALAARGDADKTRA